MANNSFFNKFLSLSPHIEMIVRRIYYKNIHLFLWLKSKNRFKINLSVSNKVQSQPLDYNKIKLFLQSHGVSHNCLLLVHSSYDALKGKGKYSGEVVDFLLDLVGAKGTLAMPAFPKFPNKVKKVDYLSSIDNSNTIYRYDVKNSSITTGVLPLKLSKLNGAVRSRFPINTMVALGPLSEELFCDEFKEKSPLACGLGSSWKKCIDNDAKIVSLGTDLTHSLTAIHVAEDAYEGSWYVKNWYIKKKFEIIDKNFSQILTLRERAPHWGALCYAERTLCKDLIAAGILKSVHIDGVLIEILSAKKLLAFLRKKQNDKPGYPYYWV